MTEKDDCPFWKGPCKQHECRLYVQLIGTNANTGQPVNQWDCTFAWWPIMQVETTQQVGQMGAAIESLRNEMVKMHEQSMQLSMFDLADKNGIKFIKEM